MGYVLNFHKAITDELITSHCENMMDKHLIWCASEDRYDIAIC